MIRRLSVVAALLLALAPRAFPAAVGVEPLYPVVAAP